MHALARLGLLIALLLLPAGAKAALPLVTGGTLTFCAALQNPPSGSRKADGRTAEGIGPDLMSALAGRMGLRVAMLNYRAAGIFAALDTGKCDAIMASLSRSPERLKRYRFVDYFKISSGFLEPQGTAKQIRAQDDLAGRRIAVLLGSRNEAWLREQNDTFAARGLAPMAIVSLGTNVAAFEDLSLGRVDALLSDSMIINHYMSRHPGRYGISPVSARAATTLGIAVPKAKPQVAVALRSALDALVANGTVSTITRRWGVEKGVTPCSTAAPCSPPDPKETSILPVPIINFDAGFFFRFVFHPPPVILQGIIVTVSVAIVAQVFGTVFGFGLALMALGRSSVLRCVNALYTWVFRGTPVLVQLVIVYFGLPYLIGFDLFPAAMGTSWLSIPGAIVAGSIAFGLHEAALMSEIIRGAISSIDRGQTEAARALGMWPRLVMRRIILPQAARMIAPPLGNQFNNMLKTTSLLSVIGVGEMFRVAEDMQATTLMTFEVYLGISIYYLALTALSTLVQRRIERRLARSMGRDVLNGRGR